jgi:CubicO group peptidase (beta-lactamase class C family)
MRRAFSLALGLFMASLPAIGAEPGTTDGPREIGLQIERIVQPLLKEKKGVGVVVAVVDRSGQRAFGYGDIAADGAGRRPPDGDTVFEIGSITKVFTTLVLAQMARGGELKLDDPVTEYLPREAKIPRRNHKDITLAHLATHTSGLPIAPADIGLHVLVRPGDWDNPYAHYDAARVHGFLAGYSLQRDPGESYEYSNLGLGLLGEALTRRAHASSYEELIAGRIAEPLGMKDTRISLSQDQRARFASGHDDDGEPTSAWDFAALAGFGALRSTGNDLLRFLSANLGLTPSKLRDAMEDCHKGRADTPDKQVRVGLGWHLLRPPGAAEPVICHSGETGGSRAFIGFRKSRGVGAIVLSNSAQLGNQIDLVGLRVLDRLSGNK